MNKVDTKPPSVSITNPLYGSVYTTSQVLTISALASDNVGVKQVEFYDNNSYLGVVSASPYNYSVSMTAANNGSHSFTAKATDFAGNSRTSSAVMITVNIPVADTQAPSIPSGLSASVISSSQINLQWSASTDNVGVTGYQIFRCQGVGCVPSTLIASSSTPSYSNTGLLASSTYVYAVKSYDAAGNYSALSNSVSATTLVAPDTQAPSVAITSPASGANYTSAQTVSIQASASDNVGVTKVEFYDNGVLKGTSTSSPYSYAMAITSANNGSHSLTAKAYDSAGNSATSSAVSITVNIPVPDTQAPSIPSGLSASVISSSQINLQWSASTDNVGVTGYQIFRCQGVGCVPSALIASSSTPSYSNTGLLASSTYVYAVKSYDAAGNYSVLSSSVSATTLAAPDTQAPSVAITSPASGASYTTAQTVSIQASASDNVGVSKVEFYDNGILKGTSSTSPYSYAMAITSANNGSHSLTAKAYDAAGNSTVSAPVSLTVNIAVVTGTGGNHLWSKRFGGTGSDQGYAIARGNNGDLVIAGNYQNAVDFGTGSLPCTSTRNLVVAKYKVGGAPLWASCVAGGSGMISAEGVASDGNGNVAVTGFFGGTVQFGSQSLTSYGGTDIFVAKFSTNGALLWVKIMGDIFSDRGRAVTFDSLGNILVTGNLQGTTAGSDQLFARKYGLDGTLLWSRSFMGMGTLAGKGIQVDAQDNVILVGQFYGTIQLGGTNLTWTSGDPVNVDLLLAKFDSSGTLSWAKSFKGTGEKWAFGLGVNKVTGEIAIGGNFWTDTGLGQTVEFGGGTLTSGNNYNGFLVKYDSNGNYLWQRILTMAGRDVVYAPVFDPVTGDVFITASFEMSENFGGSTFTSQGSSDIAVARYNGSTGAHLWSKAFGSSGYDLPSALAFDGLNQTLTVIGFFSNTIDFGGGPLTSAGGTDIFLLQLTP